MPFQLQRQTEGDWLDVSRCCFMHINVGEVIDSAVWFLLDLG